MSDTDRHDGTRSPSELPLAALLRLAADGEISAEQERRLEIELERDPDLARRVEADRMLRAATERAFGIGPDAPTGLRERVASAMAALDPTGESDAAATEGADTDDTRDLPTRLAPATRERSFWAGPAARMLAAAAALTLLATVFVVTRGSAGDPTLGTRTRAVQFVATEHGRCVTDIATGADKFVVTDPDAMPGFTGGVLGSEITLGDLVAGGVRNVRFVDAGECHVPGGGSSMHLRFEVPGEEGPPERFSLFVQRDAGRLGLEEGVSYELDPSGGGKIDLKSPTVYVWLRDGLVYYLVVDNAKACPVIRERLAAPAEIEPITNAA